MRGLDDLEYENLDRCVRRSDGQHVPFDVRCNDVTQLLVFNRLKSRGLVTTYMVWTEFGHAEALSPTPLGRLALRIKRAFRSGAALKGIVQ